MANAPTKKLRWDRVILALLVPLAFLLKSSFPELLVLLGACAAVLWRAPGHAQRPDTNEAPPDWRTLAWLGQFRRLAIRYERRADIHHAFVSLACALICFNAVDRFC